MDFKLVNNKLQINIDKQPRTQRQLLALNKFLADGDIASALTYLKSFTSSRRSRLYIDRIKDEGPEDKLKLKTKNNVVTVFQKMLDNGVNHVPYSKDHFLGIEIECFIPLKSVNVKPADCRNCEGSGTDYYEDDDGNEHENECSSCEGSGIRSGDDHEEDAHESLSEMFKDNGIKHTTIKGDGSIRPDDGYFGVEVTVLTRLSNPDNLKKVCALLSKLGTKVNKSCGMHVHLDMRHKNLTEVLEVGKNFGKVLPVLSAMIPKTRRDNSYCLPRVSRTQRYSAVNLTAYKKYRTIEIRMHSSTTDFNKIMNWCTLLNAIAITPVIKKRCTELNDLTNWVKISEDLLEYCTQRIALFSDKSETVNASAIDSDSTEVATNVISINGVTRLNEGGSLTINTDGTFEISASLNTERQGA